MTASAPQIQAEYFVAPAGNDFDPGTAARPFATLARAREAVRAANRAMTGALVVNLRGGIHTLAETFALGPEDSGANGHNVIYRSYPGEQATLSGGRRISGWTADERGRWQAAAPVREFRQLYVNGRRAPRARSSDFRKLEGATALGAMILPRIRSGSPAAGGLEPWSMHGYRTSRMEMADWTNPEDLEFCYQDSFCHTRCKVWAIGKHQDYLDIFMKQPDFTIAKTKEGRPVEYPTYFENTLELMTEPGQWYLNRKTGVVYYRPRPGEKPDALEFIAPGLERLLEIRGTPEQPARNIQFVGLHFEHGSWLEPNRNGLIDVQANFTLGPEAPLFLRNSEAMYGFGLRHGECRKSPANVVCHAAQAIVFENCRFARLGGAGLDLECGARDNVVRGCEFTDISGSAIQVGDVTKNDHHPDDPRLVVKNNRVENCFIHDSALEYKGGVGIFVGYTEGTVLANNEICSLPYSGISAGWGWGETDAGGGAYPQPFAYATPTPAKNNRIERNHIHHVMAEMEDGAGIYTLGDQPGTLIAGNHLHDNPGYPGGIYLDEGSAHIEVAGNAVYRVSKPLFFNNRAQDRIKTCPVHDNLEVALGENKAVAEIAACAGRRN